MPFNNLYQQNADAKLTKPHFFCYLNANLTAHVIPRVLFVYSRAENLNNQTMKDAIIGSVHEYFFIIISVIISLMSLINLIC